MEHKKKMLSLVAVAMLSVGGFSAAKMMNQNALSDQVLANIEAVSAPEIEVGVPTACFESSSDTCFAEGFQFTGWRAH